MTCSEVAEPLEPQSVCCLFLPVRLHHTQPCRREHPQSAPPLSPSLWLRTCGPGHKPGCGLGEPQPSTLFSVSVGAPAQLAPPSGADGEPPARPGVGVVAGGWAGSRGSAVLRWRGHTWWSHRCLSGGAVGVVQRHWVTHWSGWMEGQSSKGPVIVGRPASRRTGVCPPDSELQCGPLAPSPHCLSPAPQPGGQGQRCAGGPTADPLHFPLFGLTASQSGA